MHTPGKRECFRLYHHRTDGGAEYLSPVHLPGTDEGIFKGAAFIIRLDGEPEFSGPPPRLIAAAPELLSALKYIVDCGDRCPESLDMVKHMRTIARAAIAAAEGRG